jgi:pimeloyl-ACP methyl ester carboxylesterase
VVASGLRHHVIVWNDAAPVSAERPSIVLLHGLMDLAWSWEGVARRLATPRAGEAPRRVVAFDWRGHGETDPVGAGGYYHFPDYARDLDALLPLVAPGEAAVDLVGHSMGGSAAVLFTGARPARVRRLALLEGLGPPDMPAAALLDRTRAFLDGVARVMAERRERPMRSLDEAVARMRQQHPDLTEALGRFLASKATRPARAEAGAGDAETGGAGTPAPTAGLVWRFDPLHRTTSPSVFRADQHAAFLEAVRCPALALCGERGFRPADEATRLSRLRARLVELRGAGHMMHWTHPDEVASTLRAFLGPGDPT